MAMNVIQYCITDLRSCVVVMRKLRQKHLKVPFPIYERILRDTGYEKGIVGGGFILNLRTKKWCLDMDIPKRKLIKDEIRVSAE